MRLLELLRLRLRRRPVARGRGYGPEVLYAGWVDLPRQYCELRSRANAGIRQTLPVA